MYPGTIVHWHDESAITTAAPAVVDNSPLFLTASSFDKGPEGLRVVRGQEFYDLYGSNIDFFKHGQPAIQAANIINGGGRLLVKRLVAYDATLANKIFVATFNQILNLTADTEEDPEAKTAAAIAEEYSIEDPNFDTTTETKYLVSVDYTISWSTSSVVGAKTFDEVKEAAADLEVVNPIVVTDQDPEAGTITLVGSTVVPVFVVVDNGRGVSRKAVRIVPDFNSSKDMANFFYTLVVYEDTNRRETVTVAFNPDTVIGTTNYAITQDTLVQVRIELMDDVYAKVRSIYAEITGLEDDVLDGCDLLFAHTNRNAVIDGIELDPESIDLSAVYGNMVENGDNGSFGDVPFGSDEYINAARWFFFPDLDGAASEQETEDLLELKAKYDVEGESDKIFDLDDYHICAVFDANYPDLVKEAIAKLVTFREDCTFFRDYGLEVSSFSSILTKQATFSATSKNKFVADYLTTYQIYDPQSQKRIRVTMMYDFARQMVYHFVNGAHRPLAGIVNNMILASAIEGTINFTPRITPSVNQKADLEDARINYAIFQSGNCVVQSLYTAQEAYTQLSYVNNVLAIQEVVRAVRVACPKYRYTFITGSDFSEYAEAVERVLSNYISSFAELGFTYEQDKLKAAQKIFYAIITFRFNNWAQTEEFDLYALPSID